MMVFLKSISDFILLDLEKNFICFKDLILASG